MLIDFIAALVILALAGIIPALLLFGGALPGFLKTLWGKARIILSSPVPLLLLCFFTYYAGSKQRQAGADSAVGLYWVNVETNNTAQVYYSGTAATNTPVAWRNLTTERWNEITKIDPVVSVTNGTNVLSFAFGGSDTNAIKAAYWWIGSSRPAVVVEMTGITITSFLASSTSVSISWTCDDANANLFVVQAKRMSDTDWFTLGSTTGNSYTHSGFTVGETMYYRVISTYTREASDE